MDVYKQFGVSLAELQLKSASMWVKIGKYLFEQLEEFNHKAAVYNMAWPIGSMGAGRSGDCGSSYGGTGKSKLRDDTGTESG